MSRMRDHILPLYSECNVVNFKFRACEEFRKKKVQTEQIDCP